MPAIDLLGTRGDRRTPAQRRTRSAPDLSRHRRLDRARRGAASVDLPDTPGRARIELRQRLHGPEPCSGVDLLAAIEARQQQAEQPLLVQPVDHLGRKLPQQLVFRSGCPDDIGDRSDAIDRANRDCC